MRTKDWKILHVCKRDNFFSLICTPSIVHVERRLTSLVLNAPKNKDQNSQTINAVYTIGWFNFFSLTHRANIRFETSNQASVIITILHLVANSKFTDVLKLLNKSAFM